MNLNPYQNDLLSSYLEKSAVTVRVNPPKPRPSVVPTGNGRDFRLTSSTRKGPVRPLTVAPPKPALPPPTRNTGLSSSGDGPYPLAIRRNNDTPKVFGRDAAAFYRNLVNGGRPHLGDVDIRNIQDYVGNNMYKLDEGVWIGDMYIPGRSNISHNKPRPKGTRVINAEIVDDVPAVSGRGSGNGGLPPGGKTPFAGADMPGSNIGGTTAAKNGRPWYKNPWIIGGGAAGTLGAGGAALYNYASNAAKETTDAAPTPGGAPDNNSNNNTPTPNEAPESEGWWDSILEWVQENPELAMLILAGGGFAGGALLAR